MILSGCLFHTVYFRKRRITVISFSQWSIFVGIIIIIITIFIIIIISYLWECGAGSCKHKNCILALAIFLYVKVSSWSIPSTCFLLRVFAYSLNIRLRVSPSVCMWWKDWGDPLPLPQNLAYPQRPRPPLYYYAPNILVLQFPCSFWPKCPSTSWLQLGNPAFQRVIFEILMRNVFKVQFKCK